MVSPSAFQGFYIITSVVLLQINDVMDMGMDNVDEEADDVYNGILGEIGLEYSEKDPVIKIYIHKNWSYINQQILQKRVKGVVKAKNVDEEQKEAADYDDLEARLAILRS